MEKTEPQQSVSEDDKALNPVDSNVDHAAIDRLKAEIHRYTDMVHQLTSSYARIHGIQHDILNSTLFLGGEHHSILEGHKLLKVIVQQQLQIMTAKDKAFEKYINAANTMYSKVSTVVFCSSFKPSPRGRRTYCIWLGVFSLRSGPLTLNNYSFSKNKHVALWR